MTTQAQIQKRRRKGKKVNDEKQENLIEREAENTAPAPPIPPAAEPEQGSPRHDLEKELLNLQQQLANAEYNESKAREQAELHRNTRNQIAGAIQGLQFALNLLPKQEN